MVSAKILRKVLIQQNKSKMTKFDSRLRQQCSKLYNIVVGVLSLAPCYVRKKQVQVVDQTTHPPKCHSFVGLDRQIGSSPPALFRKGEDGRKKREKFYICLDVTHTHTLDKNGSLYDPAGTES